MTLNNANQDLVNNDAHTKFYKILKILSGNERVTEPQNHRRTG